MATERDDDEDVTPAEGDFEEKASELDYDVWGADDDDASRRRDPLRRRSPGEVDEDEDEDEES